jgi:hypothetical protein
MKIVFERDISAFHGKNWKERMDLRRKANRIDKRIPLISSIWGIFYTILICGLVALNEYLILVIMVPLIFLLSYLLYLLVINPMMKNALEKGSTEQTKETNITLPNT